MTLLNFRAKVEPVLALELMMLSSEKKPPMIGRMPSGSGELRSWNHKKPSVRMAGQIVKSYDSLLMSEMYTKWTGIWNKLTMFIRG